MNLTSTLLKASCSFSLDHLGLQEIEKYIATRQQQIEQFGIKKGDITYIKTGRGNHYWLDLLSTWSLGAVPAPLDYQSDQTRLDKLIKKAPPAAILGMENHEWQIPDCKIIPKIDHINGETDTKFTELATSDMAAILFTSGTTGDPKGVMITYETLIGNALATQKLLHLAQTDKLQIAVGFQFVSALSHFLVAMLSGVALFTTEKPLFQAELIELIEKNNITCFGGSPLQLRWIAEFLPTSYQELQWLMSSGDHLSKDVITKLTKNLPNAKVFTVYGLTELSGRFCALKPKYLKQYPGSVGKPIDGMAVKILNDVHEPCKPLEIGHVYATGEYLSKGYVNQATPELTEYGFKTGDLGYLNEAGFLYLAGRSDNVFKSAGKKVSTLPITESLMATGNFSDAVVMSVEDDIVGKVPAAFFTPKTNYQLKKGKLIRELRKSLPENHIPLHFIELKSIPRTGSGKPKYKELKKVFLESVNTSCEHLDTI